MPSRECTACALDFSKRLEEVLNFSLVSQAIAAIHIVATFVESIIFQDFSVSGVQTYRAPEAVTFYDDLAAQIARLCKEELMFMAETRAQAEFYELEKRFLGLQIPTFSKLPKSNNTLSIDNAAMPMASMTPPVSDILSDAALSVFAEFPAVLGDDFRTDHFHLVLSPEPTVSAVRDRHSSQFKACATVKLLLPGGHDSICAVRSLVTVLDYNDFLFQPNRHIRHPLGLQVANYVLRAKNGLFPFIVRDASQ